MNLNDLIIFGIFDEDVFLNESIYEELNINKTNIKKDYEDIRTEINFYPIDENYNLLNNIKPNIKKVDNDLYINKYEIGFDFSNLQDDIDQIMLGFIVNKNYFNVNFYFHIKINENIVYKKKYTNLNEKEINFFCLIKKNKNFIEIENNLNKDNLKYNILDIDSNKFKY